MIFLRSISIKQSGQPKKGFPFSLPVIQNLEIIELSSAVTFFVGENGSGKSTLLEAIAAGFGSITIGSSDIKYDKSLKHAHDLADRLKFVRNQKPKRGFFFRAEDFFGFTQKMIRERESLIELEAEFNEELSGYGRKLAAGMVRGQRAALEGRYGDNPDAFSHGENMLNLMENRLVPNGLYLLDEPETPLSPIRQLTLIFLLKEMVANDCQFIIATHSPILMAFPNAEIFSFDDGIISKIAFEDTEHVNITKAFLNDPESFLRRL
ncbi:AAA family ATPase [bacterium]|nr:AAA family ATPase [bacterium]